MSVQAVEQPEHRRLSPTSGRRQYWISGAADEIEALAALFAEAPEIWNEGSDEVVRLDKECEVFEIGVDWFGVANYGTEEQAQGQNTQESRFTFDTTGATEHILASLATVGAFAAPGETAQVGDNGNLIGVGDGDSVEGVDIPVPKLAFTVTKEFNIDGGTSAFIDSLATIGVNSGSVTVTTDDGITITAAAGELAYFGATGGTRGSKLVVCYQLAKSKNITGRTIGDIAGISAKGWDYIWTRNRHVVVNGRLTVKPVAAYVERVFNLISFSAIGL